MDVEKFEDGSSIEWFSRETLMYRSGEFEVQVAYELFHAGIFKTGRKVFQDSVQHWERFPVLHELELECRFAAAARPDTDVAFPEMGVTLTRLGTLGAKPIS